MEIFANPALFAFHNIMFHQDVNTRFLTPSFRPLSYPSLYLLFSIDFPHSFDLSYLHLQQHQISIPFENMAPVTRSMAKNKSGDLRSGKFRAHKATKNRRIPTLPTPAPHRRITEINAGDDCTYRQIRQQPWQDRRKHKTESKLRPRAFRLLDLPQEIVDMIYPHMIREGHVNIL